MSKQDIQLEGRGGIRLLHAMMRDIGDIIDMMDDVDADALKKILIATHDRYAVICGARKHDDVDVDVDVDVDSDDDEEEGYRKASMRMGDAVDDPTRAQRANLPADAFVPAAFFAGDDGGFDPDGEFRVSKSKLPHHIDTVRDPDGNESVDVPRLRNALARFDQVDWRDFPEGTKAKTRAHLERHADAILASRAKECKTCREEDAELLALDIADFRAGRPDLILSRLNAKT